MLQFHLAVAWLILAVGGISLICGVALLITRWRSLAPVASADTPVATGDAASARPATATPAAPATGLARVFRWSLIVTAALGLVQAAAGGILLLLGQRPSDPLHYVYGAIVLLAIPVGYVYSDQKQVRRDFVIMTIALVAVVGAAARAYMTGMGMP
ncbi:MAG TPA: hypothetical protein VMV29_06350 [Ktedonobacterales bacterium]|nr:hypothetical protein [Ktedonobacterales bacterium]